MLLLELQTSGYTFKTDRHLNYLHYYNLKKILLFNCWNLWYITLGVLKTKTPKTPYD